MQSVAMSEIERDVATKYFGSLTDTRPTLQEHWYMGGPYELISLCLMVNRIFFMVKLRMISTDHNNNYYYYYCHFYVYCYVYYCYYYCYMFLMFVKARCVHQEFPLLVVTTAYV